MTFAKVDWKLQLIDQMDIYWEHYLTSRLRDLDDQEFFWEPVPNCWTVHSQAEGTYRFDRQTWPEPDPPPFTTIAWRMTHLISVFGRRASNHFGDGSFSEETMVVRGTAKDAIAELNWQHGFWRSGLVALTEEELGRPCGPVEGRYGEAPLAALVQHIHREFIHHGSEICLLRDLYRYRASLRPEGYQQVS
jgi:hypothetical protein